MEVDFIWIQVGYCEDGKFESHSLTSWPRISNFFVNSLLKLQQIKNLDWPTHLELDWKYFTIALEKIGNSCSPHLNLHVKWEPMFYLFLIWMKRSMAIGHLLTHVPSTMLNNFDGDKEKIFTMQGPIPLTPIWTIQFSSYQTNIGNTIRLTYLIGHKHGRKHEMDLECWHVSY
jgi:hypothetical protein